MVWMFTSSVMSQFSGRRKRTFQRRQYEDQDVQTQWKLDHISLMAFDKNNRCSIVITTLSVKVSTTLSDCGLTTIPTVSFVFKSKWIFWSKIVQKRIAKIFWKMIQVYLASVILLLCSGKIENSNTFESSWYARSGNFYMKYLCSAIEFSEYSFLYIVHTETVKYGAEQRTGRSINFSAFWKWKCRITFYVILLRT